MGQDYRLGEQRSIPETTEDKRRWVWLLIVVGVLLILGWLIRHGVQGRFATKAQAPVAAPTPPVQDSSSKVIAKLKDRQELGELPVTPVVAPAPVAPAESNGQGIGHDIRQEVSKLKTELVPQVKQQFPPKASGTPALSEDAKAAKAYAAARARARRGMTVWTPEASKDKRDKLSEVKQYPSPYTVAAGEVINCSLETGLNSDIGGLVKLRVRSNVYDSVTGTHLMIPQSGWFIATRASKLLYGQSRIDVTLKELHWGNGQYVMLKGNVSDQTGAAGLTQHVDRKWGSVIAGVFLNSALRGGTQAVVGGTGGGVDQRLIGGLAQETSQTGTQQVRQYLDTSPTVTVDPSYPCAILLEQNLSLAQAYQRTTP